MSTRIKHGLRTGLTFGIASVFLYLIGLPLTTGELIKDTLHNGSVTAFGFSADVLNTAALLGIIGIVAGWVGGRRLKDEDDTWQGTLLGALSAGLVAGLLVAGIAYLMGRLSDAGVQTTTYLAAMLPASIKLWLLDKSTTQGALLLLVFVLVTGLLGGMLGFALRRERLRSWGAGSKRGWSAFTQNPRVEKVRRHPAYIGGAYLVAAVILLIIPKEAGQYWNYTLGTVGIYVLLGLGLNVVVGLTGLLDLGYVAFFAIGAYSMGLLSAPAPHHIMWSFWVILPIAFGLAALAGILLGIPVLRMRGDYLAIVTLGFGEIIHILVTSDLMSPITGGPKGVTAVGGPTLLGRPFRPEEYVYLIMLAVLITVLVTNRLRNSRVGRAWEAMREDETVSAAMGINTLSHKLMAFSIGAAFAGIGGALFAARNQFTGPEDFTLIVSINVLALVIVGGMGSIPGVIAGAFVLKGLPEVLRAVANYRLLIFGALLVAMMIVRPAGLIPSSRRKMELKREPEEEGQADPPGEHP